MPSIRIHALARVADSGDCLDRLGCLDDFQRRRKQSDDARLVSRTCSRLQFTEQRLLPSWWLSTGLLEASRDPSIAHVGDPPWAESLMFLALLVSNAMFFNLLATLAGRQSLSHQLQPPVRRTDRPSPRQHLVVGRLSLARGAVFLPRDVRVLSGQGFSPVPSRSGAMVAVSHFLRLARLVFREHSPLQLQPNLFRNDRLFESGRRRTDSLHVHHAVYFPDGQPGRPPTLDSGLVADSPRLDFVVEISVCRGRFAHPVHNTCVPERFDAANHRPNDLRVTSGFVRGAMSRTVGESPSVWVQECPICAPIHLRKLPPVSAAR